LVGVVAGCGLPDGDYFGRIPDPIDPTHLRYCNAGEPEYLDPALTTDTVGLKIVFATFAGLTDFDLQGLPEPGLALRWEVADDLRRFTFHLRRDARWSDGTPLTSADVAYHIARVLNPYTLSANAETLWKIANGKLYYANAVREVVVDAPPFAAGDVVELLAQNGTPLDELGGDDPRRDTNTRTSAAPLALRDLRAPVADAYARVPAGAPVIIIERSDDRRWSYVFWPAGNGGDGVYGWVPAVELSGQPYADVVYRVRSIADPSCQGEVRGERLLMHPGLLGVETPDPYTVVLRTDNPWPAMIQVSPNQALRPTPRRAVSRQPKRWSSPDRLVSSGAFHITALKSRDRLELVKSTTYFGADQVRLERITVYSMDDQAASVNYYVQGGCDAIAANHIPTSYLPVLSGAQRGGRRYLDYITAPYLGIYFYFVQTQRLDNVHLRRALAFAIDRSAFPKLLKAAYTPSAQLTPGVPIAQLSDADLAACGVTRDHPGVAMVMSSGTLCYVPPPGLDFDPQRAREELALAREQLGAAFPEPLSLKYNTGKEGHKLVAEYLQYEWQRHLGLRVELGLQEWKTFLKDTRDGNYEVARFGWIGNFPDPEESFLSPFKCASPDNRARWCNAEFERLVDLMERTTDRKQRLRRVFDMERLVVEEAAVLPLYVYTQYHLIKPYVRNLAVNFTDRQPWRYVWLDPDWRRGAPAGAP
jgi:oligopeptide transport system substrate-binding protein